MIGARMRQARLAAGLTLDAVSEELKTLGFSVTKSALSKYEREQSHPPARLLLDLARVLGVDPAFFMTPEPEVGILFDRFRKKSRLTKTKQEQLKAAVSERIRSFLALVDVMEFPLESIEAPMKRRLVRTPEQAEDLSVRLRGEWELGLAPIESVSQVLEDHGVIVLPHRESGDRFDGLSGYLDGGDGIPIVIFDPSWPHDRRRLSMAHELGHLAMEHPAETDDRECERLAFRFAASFLVPAQVVRRELGNKRRALDLNELAVLKRKYGLSIFAWIRRARDLDIITQIQYTTWCRYFSSRGWRKEEPVPYRNPFEEPVRMKQLALRAVAEGRITQARAARLCPDLAPDTSAPELGSPSLRRFRAMSPKDQDAYLEQVAERAARDYEPASGLVTEAYGEEDWIDDED